MSEAEKKIKTKEAFEKARIAELRRKKMEGDLIPKDEVIKTVRSLMEMSERNEVIDWHRLIRNIQDYKED